MRKITRREFNKLLTIGIIMPSSLLITPHFSVAEMQCRCLDPNCERKHSPDLDADFMKMLEELRIATFALRISSGARCLAHDNEVSPKKKKKGGVHVQGIAADILVGHLPTSEVLRLTKTATEIGFSGYGFALANKNRAKRFIHIDSRSSTGGAIWSY